MKSTYFVVPAPGHYGDAATVISSHGTLSAAKRSAGKGYCVREGSLRKGARWVRVYEQTYPMV